MSERLHIACIHISMEFTLIVALNCFWCNLFSLPQLPFFISCLQQKGFPLVRTYTNGVGSKRAFHKQPAHAVTKYFKRKSSLCTTTSCLLLSSPDFDGFFNTSCFLYTKSVSPPSFLFSRVRTMSQQGKITLFPRTDGKTIFLRRFFFTPSAASNSFFLSRVRVYIRKCFYVQDA